MQLFASKCLFQRLCSEPLALPQVAHTPAVQRRVHDQGSWQVNRQIPAIFFWIVIGGSLLLFLKLDCVFICFVWSCFFATSCRIQPTRSAQQKKRTPPVQSAPPPKRLPPPEPEPQSPPKKSSPSPPLLPPLRQWLSHEDMHLVRKERTYLLKPEEC